MPQLIPASWFLSGIFSERYVITHFEGFVLNPPVFRIVAMLYRVGQTWLPLFGIFHIEYYLCYITDEGSKFEILSRIARTTAALTRFKPVWIERSFFLSSKIRLMRSLVTSIFLYVCELWTLTAELRRKIHAMELRCYRKTLCFSYKGHVTNEEVRAKIQQAIGLREDLLTIVK